jgi:hypothetical protein
MAKEFLDMFCGDAGNECFNLKDRQDSIQRL